MAKADEYIRLQRSVLCSEAWKNATLEQIKAYLDLCCRVAYGEHEIKTKYGTVKLEKGQMVMSLRNLGKEWNCNFNKVYRILNSLETIGLIKKEAYGERFSEHPEHPFTILTVNALSEHTETDSERIREQDNNNNNSSNEEYTPSNTRARVFVKPTIEEVRHYLDQRGITAFTAEAFWNYYESIGWQLGHNRPIKSWQCCVTTWVRREKEYNNNYGNQNSYRPRDRKAEAAQRHQEFAEHIMRKLNGQEKRSDELPFD